MIRFAKLEFAENGDEGKLKGEAFDDALSDALGEVEIDGWEVKSASLVDSPKKQAKELSEMAATLDGQLDSLLAEVEAGRGLEASKVNGRWSNAQMLAWTIRLMLSKPPLGEMKNEPGFEPGFGLPVRLKK